MAYASRQGRARISPRNPEAAGVCDRCGFIVTHSTMSKQSQYGGSGLITFNLLVCDRCLDIPQPQLKAIAMPADPVPLLNPRIPDYGAMENDYRFTSQPPTIDPATGIPIPGGDPRATQNGSSLSELPYGNPRGFAAGAVMPLIGTEPYNVLLPVLSVSSDGSDQITVTCSAPHNMETDEQVSVSGLANPAIDGFYSVVVTTATAFTFQTYDLWPSQALFQGETRIITTRVGLPRGFNTIVQLG